jgi:hypothetical protein
MSATPSCRTIEYVDRPPSGWFTLDVMKEQERGRDWVALMIDVPPNDFKTCACEFPALFYVHPKEYRPGSRKAQQRWLRVPDKYRTKDAARNALKNMLATRH